MVRFKVWEVLLFIAVVLLGSIAYESHKANKQKQGRYVSLINDRSGAGSRVQDTQTGKVFYYNVTNGKWSVIYPAIPNNLMMETDGGEPK